MRRIVLSLAAIAATGLLAAPVSLQEREVMGSSPYDVVDNWMKPFAAAGHAWGSHPGVFAESPDRIFVIQRGEYRLPDPVPSGFAGFVGSIGLNALNPGDARVWRNCIFVVDGASISANLGVNPSLTIAAQAERAASFWPSKGEPDLRPPLGADYERLSPVAPSRPCVVFSGSIPPPSSLA